MPAIELIVLIMVPLIFTAVIAVFATILTRSNSRLAEEAGRRPLFEARMGGRIGQIKYTAPFVRCALYSDTLVVSSFHQLALPFDAIDSVEFVKDRASGTLFRTVRVRHHLRDAPRRVFLYSADGRLLADRINAVMRDHRREYLRE